MPYPELNEKPKAECFRTLAYPTVSPGAGTTTTCADRSDTERSNTPTRQPMRFMAVDPCAKKQPLSRAAVSSCWREREVLVLMRLSIVTRREARVNLREMPT